MFISLANLRSASSCSGCANLAHVGDDRLAELAVGQLVVAAGEELDLVGGARHLVCAVGDLEDPVVDGLHLLALWCADVVPDACVCGDDIGLASADLGDVVDACLLDYVLAHDS